MVLFLVKKFNPLVDDMNASLLDDYEITSAGFRLKRKQIECVEKEGSSNSLENERALCMLGNQPAAVSIDFYMLLAVVITRFKVPITHVEYVQLGTQSYKACLSVIIPNGVTEENWVWSDVCSSMHVAKQCLAKKVLHFLRPIYRFVVEDVNYHMLQYHSILTMLERESCLTVKERVSGIKENRCADTVLDKEIAVTLKGVEFQIPANLPLPRPPKKRRCTSVSHPVACPVAAVVPDGIVPAQLESLFRRRNTASELGW